MSVPRARSYSSRANASDLLGVDPRFSGSVGGSGRRLIPGDYVRRAPLIALLRRLSRPSGGARERRCNPIQSIRPCVPFVCRLAQTALRRSLSAQLTERGGVLEHPCGTRLSGALRNSQERCVTPQHFHLDGLRIKRSGVRITQGALSLQVLRSRPSTPGASFHNTSSQPCTRRWAVATARQAVTPPSISTPPQRSRTCTLCSAGYSGLWHVRHVPAIVPTR